MGRKLFVTAGMLLPAALMLLAGHDPSPAENPSPLTATPSVESLLPTDTVSIDLSIHADSAIVLTATSSDTLAVALEDTVFRIMPDDPIVAMLDSLAIMKVFRQLDSMSGQGRVRKHGFEPGFVPVFSDSVLRERIERMNDNSPMAFVYNGWVRSYIDLYASRRREMTERMLGLGNLYFPFFEEQFDLYNVPLEMKYLAVIESAMNPVARSRAGAGGIWQFMFHTGRLYGLITSSYVDDRHDVTRATIAAARHLVDLYNIYEDWWLVLAAYNAGPGNVNRAIRRAGGVKDFWLIRHFLPRETQNYVPAFIAVAYVMTHAEDHNLYPVPPLYSFHDVDTIQARRQLNLRTLSELLDVPLDHLRFLNPAYRQNIIPKKEDNPYVLTLPKDKLSAFLANEEEIYNFRTTEQVRQEELAVRLSETTVYVVRRGDNLGSIARRHSTTVREIQTLNNLRGTVIHPGQRLVVSGPAPTPPAASSAEGNVHVVRRGETLGIIASRYRVSVNNIMQWNNLSSTVIQPGQQLVVRPPSGA